MQVSILGPLEVRDDAGRLIEVSGVRLRRLLLRLVVDANRAVSSTELIDAVWESELPSDEANALQTLVSRLRRALGPSALIQQVAAGYRITLGDEDLDVARFAQLAQRGRVELAAGDTQCAAGCLRAALALWHGEPLVDAGAVEYTAALIGRWDEQRLDALADRIGADIALGNAADLVAELDGLVAAYPLRERFVAQQMTALVAGGRPAEALSSYQRLREYLADELGTDPSAELQQQHVALLRNEGEDARRPNRRRTNLRSSLTSFIGRTDEAKRIAELLDGGRLATVVGPGGAGKTRLAIEVASSQIERMPGGVWLVELAPVTDVANVAQTILDALGLRANKILERRPDVPVLATMERLIEALSDSRCLLVVDNCEHLIGAVAELVEQLLTECPELKVLSTSREPLGIAGESLCMLPPLLLPPVGVEADAALSFGSVQLFADRAHAVSADFEVDADTVGSVVEIVRRLDGLPLAIELAAARLRVLPVAEIAERLSDRFRLLTGGSRTAMPRHRTLRAVVEWSWELLSPAERLLAERLAVFPSGATVRSATEVCADETLSSDDMADLLDALVDKSLLHVERRAQELRYRMLETIREFGVERLVERGQVGVVREAHARYFAALVAEAEPHLTRSEQLYWVRLLERERDNVLAALRYLGDSGDAAATIELGLSLGWYWMLLGSHSEAETWLRFAIEVPGEVDPVRRLLAEAVLAINSMATSFDEGPPQDVTSKIDIVTSLGHQLDVVDFHNDRMAALVRPMLGFFSGNTELVLSRIRDAMQSEDDWVRAAAMMVRANVNENDGLVEEMRDDVEQALALFTGIGDRWGMASTLSSLAQLHMLDGELDLSITEFRRASELLNEFGATSDQGYMYLRLANLYARVGDLDAARAAADEVRTAESMGGSRAQRVMADNVCSYIAMLLGDTEAVRDYRDSIREQLSGINPVHPLNGHFQAMSLASLASLSMYLGELDVAGEWLQKAHLTARGTKDMPIVAIVGAAVAVFAEKRGLPNYAAEVLGAAARLRGADDFTDPTIAELVGKLRAYSEPEFESPYAAGKALSREDAIDRTDPDRLPVAEASS